MSDIVRRLRVETDRICSEAADEIERLTRLLAEGDEMGFVEGLLAEIERLRALVRVMLENDPDDDAADGVTVLQVWRKEARRELERK